MLLLVLAFCTSAPLQADTDVIRPGLALPFPVSALLLICDPASSLLRAGLVVSHLRMDAQMQELRRVAYLPQAAQLADLPLLRVHHARA